MLLDFYEIMNYGHYGFNYELYKLFRMSICAGFILFYFDDFYFVIVHLYSGMKLVGRADVELFDLHASNAHRDVFV